MHERLASIPPILFTPDGSRLNKRAYFVLVLLCIAFFVPGLATMPPTDRDESLFAQASKQMIETNNYVDIRFQDAPRYKKPVGIYWLQVASVKLLNPHHLDQIWAYRIPSLIGAIVAVVMTAALGALFFGPMAGFLAAVMMTGCLILNVEARLAKTDAALLGSIMVAQYGLARAYIGYGVIKIGKAVPVAFWTALGIGILLKGPIILMVVLSTLIWLRVSQKNLTWFKTLYPALGIPYLLLLIAPWFAAIMMASHGAFLQQSAGHDLLGKLWQDQGRGFIPPGTYLLAFPITFFPFALFALLAIPDTWRNRQEPAVWFCLGWILPCWIMFELALAKLPHYTMPLYPPIAMLAAKALLDGFPALMERKFLWIKIAAAAIYLISGIGLAYVAITLPYIAEGYWNKGQIAAALLLLIAQAASLLYLFNKSENGAIIIAAGSLVFFTGLFANTLPRLPSLWPSSEIVRTAESIKPCPGSLQLISNYNEPSLVFLAGTQTILLNDGAAIAKTLQEDTCRIAVVKDDQRDTFLKSFPQPLHEAATIHLPDISKTHQIFLYLMPQKGK